MTTDPKALAGEPEWPADPRVALVYEMLCGRDDPPEGRHWEGWLAEQIVAALSPESPSGAPSSAPQGQHADGWRPIESAPKDGTKVDLWIHRQVGWSAGPDRLPDCWHSAGKWWVYDEHGDDQCRSEVCHATHWMARPEPPWLSASPVPPLGGEIQQRPCTCHPDDNPPVPCPRKYALEECRLAAQSYPSGAPSSAPQGERSGGGEG